MGQGKRVCMESRVSLGFKISQHHISDTPSKLRGLYRESG